MSYHPITEEAGHVLASDPEVKSWRETLDLKRAELYARLDRPKFVLERDHVYSPGAGNVLQATHRPPVRFQAIPPIDFKTNPYTRMQAEDIPQLPEGVSVFRPRRPPAKTS